MIPLTAMESPHQNMIHQDESSIILQTTTRSPKSVALDATYSSNHPQMLLQATKDWFSSSSSSFSCLLPEPAFAATTDEMPQPPSNAEVQLLRKAFSTFYGVPRDAEGAEPLLTEAIQAWQRQSADEKAGLYRVRGDCYVALLQANKAIADYSTAINLLKSPAGEKADPAELPASLYVFAFNKICIWCIWILRRTY
jgi:predicted lipid-binding transport protein (Tim44 family)